jgi:hypothetical protein
MQYSITDEQKLRAELRAKRKLLFANFSNNPSNTQLAIEIKRLDDRISDLNGGRMNRQATMDYVMK